MDKEKAIALNNEGASHFLNKEFDKALECYKQAYELDSKNSSILNNLGLYYHQEKDFQKALEFFESAQSIEKKPHFLVNGGHSLAMMGMYEDAAMRYKQALKLDPDHKSARVSLAHLATHTGDLKKAIVIWKELMEVVPDNTYAIELAKVYMQIKDWEKALKNLHRIEVSDGDALAWRMIGQCEYQLKNFGMAQKAFKMALAENPDEVESRQHLAINYLAMGDWEEGIRQLEMILRMDPENHQIMTELAVVYLGKGNMDKATTWLEKALAIKPDFPKALRYKQMLDSNQ
ncbi:tetratricopeptide repeat protein [Cyclobacterium jeungdonense]|uniref:Tetratricopeptide repeat protein n=1 Tax=Cyclobacterium jeungdonense TaxID=708087 RepID=A0ABT8CE27_9BACT|nr:tetratricopeptide repeat protein [Cyclobacterium jeungdonense]MDN3689970.1 tetratricopeptide repeat protein [Cyclobacterium jeungdonense]